VTRATPRRSAASRCQMSRARCWPGERSTVRRVFALRVRPMAKESVGAAATEGVSGVTAACWVRDRSAPAPVRLPSEPICDLLPQERDVSMSVDQFQYIRTSVPFDSGRTADKRVTRSRWAPLAQANDRNPSDHRQERLEFAVGHQYWLLRCRDPGKDMEYRMPASLFGRHRPLMFAIKMASSMPRANTH
jgi:hypothetical protein